MSPQGATGRKTKNCGRCLTRKPAEGGKRRLELGWVCAGCDGILRGLFSTAAPAGEPKFTPCPARGLAAGWDPRTQVAPGSQVTGFFTRDWQAKRAAA